MSEVLKTCKECHRLFSGEGKQKTCDSCLRKQLDGALAVDRAVEDYGLTDIGDIASLTGLPTSRVLAIVGDTAALRDKVHGIYCERCHQPTASADARLCLECRGELNREIGDMAIRMSNRIAREAEKRAAQPVGALGMNIAHLARTKRAASAMRRFNPTPKGKYG